MYVALGSAAPDMLAGLEDLDVVALDDVGAWRVATAWERPLFGLLNEFLGSRGGLLLAAR